MPATARRRSPTTRRARSSRPTARRCSPGSRPPSTAVNDWSEKPIEEAVRRFAETENVKLGQVAQPLTRRAQRLDRVARHLRGRGDPGSGRDQEKIARRRRIEAMDARSSQCGDGIARLALAVVALRPVGRLVLLRQGGSGRTRPVHRGVRRCRLRRWRSPWSCRCGRDAPWPTYFAMGFLNNALPFSLIFWGQTEIGSGLASILNATTPLFTLVVAHVAHARREDRPHQGRGPVGRAFWASPC